MRRCRETPDWWMSMRSTMSPTAHSPDFIASTMRRRAGSARAWNKAIFASMYIYCHAYLCPVKAPLVDGPLEASHPLGWPSLLGSRVEAFAYDLSRLDALHAVSTCNVVLGCMDGVE